MIGLEEYEIKYALYEATKELDYRFATLELSTLVEQEVLEEGAKDAIQNFIKKVITGIQQSWNKFKENVAATKLKWNMEEIEKVVNNNEPKVNVTNYIVWDTELIKSNTLAVQQFNYDAMKESLDNVSNYMKRFYSSVYKDDTKSIAENIRNACIKSTQQNEYAITKNDLVSMLEYVKTYENFVKSVQSDIEAINKGSDATNFLIKNTLAEAVVDTSRKRKEALAKTIKSLEEQGLKPKIDIRAKEKWLETGDSGEFSGSLCIAGLGNNVNKCVSETNKILKSIGGKLTADNYGTAFLSVREAAFITEDETPKPQVSASPDAEKEKEDNDKSKEVETRIKTYFKCNTDILTSKLGVSREIFLFYSSVLTQHMKNVKGSSTNTDQNNNNQNNDQQNNTQQDNNNDASAPKVTT